jgi:hypothetical protein
MDAKQQQRALELCNMAHRVINEGPDGWRAMFWQPIEIGDLRIERVRLDDPERRGRLPNALNIAWRSRDVLTIRFPNGAAEPEVRHYEPGEWERELEFLLTPGHGRTQ